MVCRGSWQALALVLGLSVPQGGSLLWAAPAPNAQPIGPAPERTVAGEGTVQLKVRRLPGTLELVVDGTGANPQVLQSASGSGWMGELMIRNPGALRVGPQQLSIPELGLQRVSLEGGGTRFRLAVMPVPGVPLARPVVSADGRNLIISFATAASIGSSTARLDVTQPGWIPGQSAVPPLQPRAVAPPLGDMAVGTMVLRNRSFLNVSGPPVSMTMRQADAREVLMSLAQIGGYGFVYVDDGPSTTPAVAAATSPTTTGRPVSISFRGEPYARAFNAVLLAAGWQGRLEGRMVLAGPSVLGKSFGPQVSKVYRLNQASANSAADYLASLGAAITKVTVIANSVTQGTPQANQVAGGAVSQQTTTQNITTTETYGSTTGPLKGLTGTTDSRLQTVTLVGDSQLVAVAENYLKQIDLRQRQVALSVKILDVNLSNNAELDNSFAFRSGNSFILSRGGQLTATFGSVQPDGTANPGLSYPDNQFVDQLRALIVSSSTKVLASPTLILSENADAISSGADTLAIASNTQAGGSAAIGRKFGNEGFITVGEQVITSFTTQSSTSGAPPVCTPVFGNAGLTFGARVSRIDDNGYVSFALSPEISAVVGTSVKVEGCGEIRTINKRRLDTGNLRVRDGQTLILTGVISDDVRATVSKWPILGDIPLIGQFFRFSGTNRRKTELVIMVTPRIIDDAEGGVYGYGYMPSDPTMRRNVGAAAL
jgi:type IV pilus assembly protein PilQ